MSDITIDTTAPNYQAFLTGLGQLKTFLAPTVQLVRQLPKAEQKAWLAADPLLDLAVDLALTLAEIVEEANSG